MSELKPTNLLVGKNASGKTRTIKALQNVTNFLQMKSIVFGESEFKTKLTFINPNIEGWKLVYSFEIAGGKVVSEQLAVNGRMLIKRDVAKTVFMGQTINPPMDKLVVQVRRDREVFPRICEARCEA